MLPTILLRKEKTWFSWFVIFDWGKVMFKIIYTDFREIFSFSFLGIHALVMLNFTCYLYSTVKPAIKVVLCLNFCRPSIHTLTLWEGLWWFWKREMLFLSITSLSRYQPSPSFSKAGFECTQKCCLFACDDVIEILEL